MQNRTARLLLSEIDWFEYKKRIRDEKCVVLLPIGSLEQHGPHSPIGSDEILAHLIAVEVAKLTNSLVAPSIFYGCRSQPRSGGGNHFDGTISINGETMINLVRDVLVGFGQKGATRLMLLDAHYENASFVAEGIELAIRELYLEGNETPKILKVQYFDLLDEDVMEFVFPDGFPGWPLEHAGVMATSLHLHLTPGIVDLKKAPLHDVVEFPKYDIFPFDPECGSKSGCLHSPRSASSQKGKVIFDCVVARLTEIIKKEFHQ